MIERAERKRSMRLLWIVIVLLIGSAFVGGSALIAYRSKAYTGKKRWLTTAGGICLAVGGLGFFATTLSGLGGLRWLSPTWEWPVSSARGIIVMPDGKHVIPLKSAGRIQVYDPTWKFLRGWHVDAAGGTFILRLFDTDKVEVITARRAMRYVYDSGGVLLSEQTYAPQKYSDFWAPGQKAVVPTRWWWWPFTSPAHSWIIAVTGAILLFLAQSAKPVPNRVRQQ